ncbi:MAG TPA: PIN domain-containing protein [Candidatus Heimdallarchaeota archaeon]|nr:PIN domain-containing protein [Candidatus Heimdallarchaeota archaeon]
MKVFFDTMVFLHYRNIDEINLEDLLGTGPHTIIMPRITLRELDKHKNTNNSSRIRERARKIVKKIERWATGEQIRPGVTMEFMARVPAVDYGSLGLNPDWGDDVLIASVIQYRTDHPSDAEVTLVTQDSGPRLTAPQLGLRVFELPEEYKLPPEQDPLEAENRELLRTISVLQNALPKLIVSFAGSDQPEDHARFFLPCPPDSMEHEIERKIEELKAKLPKQHRPQATTPKSNSPVALMQAQLAGSSYIDPIPAEEYDRYNRDVDEYLSSYERYMRDTWEGQAATRRSIRFEIDILNTGTAPAEDVDALFHFPDGFRLFSEDDLPDIPKEPRPPRKPRTRMQQMADNIGYIGNLDLARANLPDFKMPSSFSIERSHSYDVRDHFSRIKHGDNATLPEMFLTFDSYQSATSFSCDYTIRPANLPTPITGKLHFVIEKENANKAIDGDKE